MSLIILFGLPGVGKTYVGEVFKKEFGFYLYDGDIDLPRQMRLTLENAGVVTDSMRDEFFANIQAKIKKLKKTYQNIVVAQTYIKEKYRANVLQELPEAQFILVQADTMIRESRLAARKNFPLDPDYARKMCLLFETPHVPHKVIMNNETGDDSVKKQITALLSLDLK